MERYWIDHCIGIARDAGNVDAAQDATKELDAALARAEAAEARLAELQRMAREQQGQPVFTPIVFRRHRDALHDAILGEKP